MKTNSYLFVSVVIICGFMSIGAIIRVPADYATIQAGLTAAMSDDTVVVSSGTYVESLTWPETDRVTLTGESQTSGTVIHAINRSNVLTKTGDVQKTMTLRDLTITGGHVSGYGGGLFINKAIIGIERCILCDNWAESNGGGAYFSSSEVSILGCIFERNQTGVIAYWSGDGLAAYFSECTGSVSYSVIRDHANWYMNGAGMTSTGGVNFSHTLFERNVQSGSDYLGGALSLAGPCSISDCIFMNNGGIGAAIGISSESEVTIFNNLFVQNHSDFMRAGTVEIWSGVAFLAFNTFVDNNPVAVTNFYGEVELYNNIITESECGIFCPEPSEQTLSDYNVLYNRYDYCSVVPGVNDLISYPYFVSADGADYLLSQIASGQTEDSPAVDTGDPLADSPSGTTRTDGEPDSGIPDRGYHYPYPALRTITPTPTNTATVTATQTPSPLPTDSPEPTATEVPSPTSTPTLSLVITTNREQYTAGDEFRVTIAIQNPGADLTVDLYIALDIRSMPELYYFYPSWVAYPPSVDFLHLPLLSSSSITGEILSFMWPENAGSGTDWMFHAALVDPSDMTLLVYDYCSFSFYEE